MLYFVPDWTGKSGSLERDKGLSIMKLFQQNQRSFKIIIVQDIPFLRYKMHDYQVPPRCFFRIYDLIRGVSITDGFPLRVEELDLSDDLEKVYTPFGISLLKKNIPCGEILFNEYGFVSQVIHFQENGQRRDEYDDRGFRASAFFSDSSGEIVRQEYFNEFGETTVIVEFSPVLKVTVKRYKELGLSRAEYRNLTEVVAELLSLLQYDLREDQVFIVANSDNLRLSQQVVTDTPLIYIVSNEENLQMYSEDEKKVLFGNSQWIVTDEKSQEHQLTQLQQAYHGDVLTSKIKRIPMYETKLILGSSNSVDQLIMYWNCSPTTKKTQQIQAVLLEKLVSRDNYGLIIEVPSAKERLDLMQQQKKIIDHHYQIESDSEEFQKVQHYLAAKKAKKLFKTDEEAIEDIRKTPLWRPLVAAVEAYDRIEFRQMPNIATIRQDFEVVRLYLDMGQQVDLQKQALAISAGIPQLTEKKTDYLEEGKNGLLVREIADLDQSIMFYLDDLGNWNQSLVENVKLIDQYSSQKLMKKWRSIIHVQKEEN